MIIIFFLLFLFFLIYSTKWITNVNISTRKKIYFRIFIDYLHYLMVIQTYNISFSSYVKNFIVASNKSTNIFNFLFSFECISLYLFGKIDIIFHSFLQINVLFLLISLVFLFFRYFYHKRRLYSFLIFYLSYLIFPIFLKYTYEKIECKEIEGKSYLRNNTNFSCHTLFYKFAVIFLIFTLLIYIIYITSLCILMYNNKLDIKLIFLIIGYKKDSQINYFIILCTFKLALIFINGSAILSNLNKFYGVLMIYFYILFIQIYEFPYNLKEFNHLLIITQTVIIAIYYSFICLIIQTFHLIF